MTTTSQDQYLLAAENQDRYDRFSQVDEPERLEAELALARASANRRPTPAITPWRPTCLATIAKLSAATTAQKIRLGELLEKEAAFRLGKQLVDLVDQRHSEIAFPVGRMPWINSPIRLRWPLRNHNEPEQTPRLLTYERHHP